MRLLDLDPQWLLQDGKRVGFTFVCPTKPEYRMSCFPAPVPLTSHQIDIIDAHLGEHVMVQPCNPAGSWAVAGGIDKADFLTMTVRPSLDGSAGGLWHGFITNGQIVGGI